MEAQVKTVIPLISQLLQIQINSENNQNSDQIQQNLSSNQEQTQSMNPNNSEENRIMEEMKREEKEEKNQTPTTEITMEYIKNQSLEAINSNSNKEEENGCELEENVIIEEKEENKDAEEYFEEYYDENGGYYDENGNYVDGTYNEENYVEEEQYYDENEGYYDENGNYIDGNNVESEESSAIIEEIKENTNLQLGTFTTEETKNEDDSLSVMDMIRKGKKNRPIFGSTIIKPSDPSLTERPERPSIPPRQISAPDLVPFSPKIGGPHMRSSPSLPFSPSIPRMSVLDRSSKDLLNIGEEDFSNEHLTKLLLSKNQITELPDSIKKLTKILMLDLSNNRFLQFPQQILHLTTLQDLLLFGNKIPNIPQEISSLANLRSLNVSSNRMAQFPDSLHTLINLTSLNLSRNKLTSIDNEKISSISDSLVTLNLQFNNINAIPSGFSFLKNLKTLKLSHNEISSFSDSSKFKNITDLDISHNHLTEIPSCFSTLSLVQRLDLSRNQITFLPSIIAEWNSVIELRLRENQIHEIPDELWALTSLQILDLTSNCIKILSSSLGNLVQMQELYLGDNIIESLPKQIGQLASLKSLNLFGNQLEEIPEDLYGCKELMGLFLGYNKLREIPQSEGNNWTELEELVLSGNKFGRLPLGLNLLSGMKSLRILLLNNCGLNDPLNHLSTVKSLTHLDLSGNRIVEVPESFAELLELIRIDLCNNRIERLHKGLFDGLNYLEELSLIGNPISFNQSFDGNELLSIMDRGTAIYLNSHPLSRSKTGQLENLTIPNTNFIEFDFSEMTGKRPSQEDALLLNPDFHFERNGENIKMDLWGVFDGHAGSAASKFSVLSFPRILKEALQEGLLPLVALEKTFITINELFKEEMDNHRVSSLERHCGSTGLVVLVDRTNKKIYTSNVGDTRAVMSKGGKAVRLSFDHKPSDEEDRINKLGGHIIGESTRRINGVIAVSRSIGDFYMQPFVICEPYLAEHNLTGDENFIIVGCDGVWDEVEDQKAVEIVSTETDLYKAAVKLRDYSYLLSSEDNISTVIIRI